MCCFHIQGRVSSFPVRKGLGFVPSCRQPMALLALVIVGLLLKVLDGPCCRLLTLLGILSLVDPRILQRDNKRHTGSG